MLSKKLRWMVLGLAVLGTATWSLSHLQAEDAKPAPEIPAATVASASELSKAFRSVHEAIKGAVVNIDIKKKVNQRQPIPEEFRRMLPPGMTLPDQNDQEDEDQATPTPKSKSAPKSQVVGTGSGVIMSPEGYILTNNHVVDGADSISVTLSDSRVVDAKVVGTDPKTDLAVIKITTDRLTYARLGDSDAIDVGDWVLAFGSPFSFDQTMTQGIISAKGRKIDIIAEHNLNLAGLTYENFLQTDAAINPGNSGGPLVNLKGEIIGINTAIASRTGGYNGIGFAIPSNDAKWIAESLIKNGKVVRGYMGIGIMDIRERNPGVREQVKSTGFTGDTGVLVREVWPDGPAGKADLQTDDIITALNGKKLESMTQLRNDVARTTPGTKITLTVYRGGKTFDVNFAVGTQPDTLTNDDVVRAQKVTPEALTEDIGLTVVDSPKGVLIKRIDPDSIFAGQGMRVGDIIYKVQGKPVKTVKDFKEALGPDPLTRGVRISVHTPAGVNRSFFFKSE